MSKEKIKDTFKLTYPRLPCHQEVQEFLKSRGALESVQPQQWERAEIELQLAYAKKVYESTMDDLQKKKQFFKKEKTKLDGQWADLERLEGTLQKTFIKLSSFIKSNEEKRLRATKRMAEDSKVRLFREQEIERLQNEIFLLQTIRSEFDLQVQNHLMYERYLDAVVDIEAMEFKTPDKIVERFEALLGTKNELGKLQTANFATLEKAKTLMARRLDEDSFHLLGMKNTIANLHSVYKDALTKSVRWENVVRSIKNQVFQRFKEVAEVKDSCRNVYLMMCRRKNEEPKIPPENLEKQLLYIKKTLNQLKQVRRGIKMRQKKFSSVKVLTSHDS